MALTKADKEWIQQQIEDSLKQRGWRRYAAGIKSWSPFGGLVAIVLFVLVQWNLSTQFRVHTEDRLTHIEASLLALQVSKAAANPSDENNQRRAKELLATARKNSIRLPVDVIQETGVRFVEASETNPQVWPVAEQYFAYRSFLNIDLAPALTPASGKSKYQSAISVHPNPTHPEWELAATVSFAGGYATGDKAARLESLSRPQPEPSEFAFFIIDGADDAIVLDGQYMKNVLIRNADVEYSGGPVVLENVYFVNCTFKSFRLTPRSRELGTVMLASASTTFKPDQTTGWLVFPR